MAALRTRILAAIARSNLSHARPSLVPHRLLLARGVASKLFIGGLSFYTTEEALSDAFSQFGQVIEAKVVKDKATERPKGFGFVTFASEDEAKRAIEEMNGKILNGRVIFVDNAKAKPKFGAFGNDQPIARGPPDSTDNM